MKVLVVGDPYMPVSAYAEALAVLDGQVDLSTMQIDEASGTPPVTASERGLREYAGDPARVARAVAGHDVLVVHGAPVSAEVLEAAPLRLVCCARGGPVNVDVAAATRRGIPVVNTPGKNAEAVAELTIAFALLLIRAVPRASRHLLEGGGFAESVYEGREFFGREAPSLTMGLVGLGHVGLEVARRAKALGFTVLGYDPVPPADPGVEVVTMDTLLTRLDIISVHARLTADNGRMFARDLFARMRPGACFINTAREALVDEDALRQALEQGILGGAALDVLERTPGRHPLLGLPNVFVTPHIGGATAETLTRGAEAAQGVRLGEGDILVFRTGHHARRLALGAWSNDYPPAGQGKAGLHVDTIEWMHERRIAAFLPDGDGETVPSNVEGMLYPIHPLQVTAMGMLAADSLQLEDVAAACSAEGRYEFMVVGLPLRLPRATGSPWNPIAIF